jgi:hypothetical protein
MGANKYWKNIKKIRLLVNGKCTLPVKKRKHSIATARMARIISTTAVFVYIFFYINFRKKPNKI